MKYLLLLFISHDSARPSRWHPHNPPRRMAVGVGFTGAALPTRAIQDDTAGSAGESSVASTSLRTAQSPQTDDLSDRQEHLLGTVHSISGGADPPGAVTCVL